jgi:hypothetical protein
LLPGAKLEDPRAHRAAHSAMRCRRASQRPSWPLPSGRPSCSYMSGRSHSEEAIFSCVVKCGSLQQCGIIKKTAMRTKSITVVAESASHAHAHRRGIMCVCCAAPGAVAAQHLMLLSRDDSCSCRETPSAALFRGCCSAARAQLDPPRTPTTLGHHRQRVARLLRWHSTRTACAASGLRCGGNSVCCPVGRMPPLTVFGPQGDPGLGGFAQNGADVVALSSSLQLRHDLRECLKVPSLRNRRPDATSRRTPTSAACAEGVSHRDVARLATHCSLSMRPLAGHPHVGSTLESEVHLMLTKHTLRSHYFVL